MPHGKERLLPDGAIALIINLREDETRSYLADDLRICRRQPGAVIVGTHSRYFVIDAREQISVAGVQFQPGGAFPFLGMPAGNSRTRSYRSTPCGGIGRPSCVNGCWPPKLQRRRLDILEQAVTARGFFTILPKPRVSTGIPRWDSHSTNSAGAPGWFPT
jgi:hypothetical protein